MTVQLFTKETDTNTTVTTTTETVALSLPAISTPGAGATVHVSGTLSMTYGTGTTAATVRVRRGTDATGTLIGESNAESVTAGNTGELTWDVSDSPGEVAGQVYVVTVQQTSATANGTVLNASGTISVS